jgi:hypothetical protein
MMLKIHNQNAHRKLIRATCTFTTSGRKMGGMQLSLDHFHGRPNVGVVFH